MTASRSVLATAGALTLALSSWARPASATGEVRLSVDWSKLGQLLHDASQLLPGDSQPDLLDHGSYVRAPGPPWLGVSPYLTFVARDWSGAQRLWGPLTLTDHVRAIRSCRMVFSRVRLSGGRIVPFAQAGLGEWRVDRDLMPALRQEVQPAGQLGGGFELDLGPRAMLAVEASYTIPSHEPPQVTQQILATLVAARVGF
jgi:hypothetical protein